MTDLKN